MACEMLKASTSTQYATKRGVQLRTKWVRDRPTGVVQASGSRRKERRLFRLNAVARVTTKHTTDGRVKARKVEGKNTDSSRSVRSLSSVAESAYTTPPDEPGVKTSVVQKIFHIVAFIQTFCVWFWHFTPAASYLPGASLYGFFFRYLTFCTYTLQTVYLGCAIVSDFTNKKNPLKSMTGTLAGVGFVMANVVTVMYYGVMQQFPAPIEGSNLDRPPYLNLSVHLFNAFIAWADLFITNNMLLSGSVMKASCIYGGVYTLWMQHIKTFTGKYPYPFLDRLPFPAGPMLVIALAFLAIVVFSKAGSKIRNKFRS